MMMHELAKVKWVHWSLDTPAFYILSNKFGSSYAVVNAFYLKC